MAMDEGVKKLIGLAQEQSALLRELAISTLNRDEPQTAQVYATLALVYEMNAANAIALNEYVR